MASKIVCILSLFSLVQSSFGRDVELDWFIQVFPDKFVLPGDTVIFSYDAFHNVHIHPTGDCTETGSILVGAEGAGTVSYTFKEEEVNTTVFFACDYMQHCEFGQNIKFNVVEEINTMAPSAAPSATTMAPSVSPTFASMAPSGSPSTTMAPSVSGSPSTMAPSVSGSPSSAPSGMPVAPPSIIDLAEATGNYGTLLGAINATGLLPTIAAEAPVTIFGPNDAAFANISDVVAGLSTDELVGVLTGHVVKGAYTASDVVAAGCVELTTLAGTQLSVLFDGMSVLVNGVTVVEADLLADDGAFHGVDGVILDGSFVPCPTPEPSTSSIPSDMPSLVPSGMPSLTPSVGPTVFPVPPSSAPTTAQTQPSSSPRNTMLVTTIVGLVASFLSLL